MDHSYFQQPHARPECTNGGTFFLKTNLLSKKLEVENHGVKNSSAENRKIHQQTDINTRNIAKMSRCRFCGEEKSHDKLMDLANHEETLQHLLQKLDFLHIDYIDLSNNLLPKTTCEYCYNALDEALEFFKKVKLTQDKLNIVYNVPNIQNEVIEDKLNIVYNVPNIQNEVIDIKFENIDDLNSAEMDKSSVYQTYKYDHKAITKCNTLIKECEDEDFASNSDESTQHNQQSSGSKNSEQHEFNNHCIANSKTLKTVSDLAIEAPTNDIYIDTTTNSSDYLPSFVYIDIIEKIPPNPVENDGIKLEEQAVNNINLDVAANIHNRKEITTKIADDNNSIKPNDTAKKPDKTAAIFKLNKHTEVISWDDFKWSCQHCKEEFNNMSEVREHSKEVHNFCYGFKCYCCPRRYRTFNAFVEHVRAEHCENLRLYCQYCFSKFESAEQCVSHTYSHWTETKVCEYCGEIFPNLHALERHRHFYKVLKNKILHKFPKIVKCDKSWQDYQWTCQDCWMPLPDMSSLRAHVRDVHDKCFSMKCIDCLTTPVNYVTFVDHVRKHRPHLEHYCQFCNMYFGEKHDLALHIEEHWSSPQPPCHGCGQIFAENAELMHHLEQYRVRNVKGVPHATVNNTDCTICRKKFKSIDTLRQHMKCTHNKQYHRNFICHICGEHYHSYSFLKYHMDAHSGGTEECKLCGKLFPSKRRLKDHAKSHLKEKPFKCDVCAKSFRHKSVINSHMLSHLNIKQHKCLSCDKTFVTKHQLKTHERQHSGEMPYSCKVCERTFSFWGNCNKHMMRMHGVTLAKTKITARGRVDIDNVTGKPKKIMSSKTAEKWLSEICSRIGT